MEAITVWQVRVGDEWRFAHPDVAAMVAVCRPGPNVRLVEAEIPRTLRFESWRKRRLPEETRVSARRLAAAERERALAGQRERAGLFSAVEADRQPTADERLEHQHAMHVDRLQASRDVEAKARRELRLLVGDMAAPERAVIMFQFEHFLGPHDSSTLRYVIRRTGLP